jgi:hypothetical protein
LNADDAIAPTQLACFQKGVVEMEKVNEMADTVAAASGPDNAADWHHWWTSALGYRK